MSLLLHRGKQAFMLQAITLVSGGMATLDDESYLTGIEYDYVIHSLARETFGPGSQLQSRAAFFEPENE